MRARPRPAVGFVLANTLLTWLAMGIAIATLWPVYQSAHFLHMVAVALLLGSAVAIAGTSRA